jgi:hypothetical protein
VRVLPSDPAPARALRWTPIGAGATDGSDTTVAAIGRVTFRFPRHFFTLVLEDPWVTVADGRATLRARVDLDVQDGFLGAQPVDVRTTLGTFPLTGAAEVTPQHVRWQTGTGLLSDEASTALGGFLGMNAELDALTLTIPRSLGALPQEPGVPDPAPPEPPAPPAPPVPPAQPGPGGDAARRARAPARPAVVTPLRKAQYVTRVGYVRIASLACGRARCTVAAPRSVALRIGGRSYRATVVVPRTIAAGRRATLWARLPKPALQRLAGRRATVRLRVVVRAAGQRTTQALTVPIRGFAAPSRVRDGRAAAKPASPPSAARVSR